MDNDRLHASHEKLLEAWRASSQEFLRTMQECHDDRIRLMNEQHLEKMAALDAAEGRKAGRAFNRDDRDCP
jgi:hypothetical protein